MGEHFRDVINAAISPGSVVAGFDGSNHAANALGWAANQAMLEHRPLAIVHGFHPVARTALGALELEGVDRSELLRGLRARARDSLGLAADEVRKEHRDLAVEAHLIEGDARQVLLDAAKDAHLVVLGSHGRGPVRGLLLGSVSVAVSQLASCPVVVCRPRHADVEDHGVVVGADGSAESAPVIHFAFRQASIHRLPLTAMHCFWEVIATDPTAHDKLPVDKELLLAESVAGFQESYPDVEVHLQLSRGLVDQVLVEAAPGAALLVVGRRRHSVVARHLHATMAAAVLERASGTVAVVPEASPAEA